MEKTAVKCMGAFRKCRCYCGKRVFKVFIVRFLLMKEVDRGRICGDRGYLLLSWSLFYQEGIR